MTFISVAHFLVSAGLNVFLETAMSHQEGHLNVHEGARPQPSSELEGASASIGAARFACRSLVFTARTVSRLSASRYGFGVSCISPLHCPPPRPGSFLLQGGRTLASEGGFV